MTDLMDKKFAKIETEYITWLHDNNISIKHIEGAYHALDAMYDWECRDLEDIKEEMLRARKGKE